MGIEHELRARRYNLLPQIFIWQEDLRRWQAEVHDWEATREASHVLGHNAHLERDVFRWPPTRPSYLPTAEEILEMCNRARAHPSNRGWTRINSTRAEDRSPQAGTGRAARRRSSLPVPEAIPKREVDEVDDDDLKKIGIRLALMPGGLGVPPPPTEEALED